MSLESKAFNIPQMEEPVIRLSDAQKEIDKQVSESIIAMDKGFAVEVEGLKKQLSETDKFAKDLFKKGSEYALIISRVSEHIKIMLKILQLDDNFHNAQELIDWKEV